MKRTKTPWDSNKNAQRATQDSTKLIVVRVTPGERRVAEARARTARQTLSQYVRTRVCE